MKCTMKSQVSWNYVLSSSLDATKCLCILEVSIRPHEYWLVINTWTRNIYCFRKMGLFILLLLHQKIVTSIIKCIVQDISRGMFFTGSNRHMLPMIVAFNAYHAKFLINSFRSLVTLLQSEEIKMVKANKVKNENCK